MQTVGHRHRQTAPLVGVLMHCLPRESARPMRTHIRCHFFLPHLPGYKQKAEHSTTQHFPCSVWVCLHIPGGPPTRPPHNVFLPRKYPVLFQSHLSVLAILSVGEEGVANCLQGAWSYWCFLSSIWKKILLRPSLWETSLYLWRAEYGLWECKKSNLSWIRKNFRSVTTQRPWPFTLVALPWQTSATIFLKDTVGACHGCCGYYTYSVLLSSPPFPSFLSPLTRQLLQLWLTWCGHQSYPPMTKPHALVKWTRGLIWSPQVSKQPLGLHAPLLSCLCAC